MMRKKTAVLLLLTVSILFLCAACGAGNEENAAVSAAGSVRTVTDVYGREVEVPAKVETVAAIGGAARIITYAGAAAKLTGVTDMDKTNNANMPYTVVNSGHFAALTSVGSGGSNDTCYIEELIALQPDVIIGLTDVDTLTTVAEKSGIPTIGIAPDSMFDDSFYAALALLGDVLGTEEHCAAVTAYIKECQEDLDSRTKDIAAADKPAVYTGGVSFKGGHGFEGTCGQYPPFTAIHANNVADETGQTNAFLVDLEKVTVWDPDIIFLNPGNMNLVNEDYAKNPAYYENLTAVRKGEVYSQISYNYNWTNMEIAIADAYYAGTVIYPAQFAGIDPAAKADEIFTKFLGAPFYETLAANGSAFGKITIGE